MRDDVQRRQDDLERAVRQQERVDSELKRTRRLIGECRALLQKIGRALTGKLLTLT
jgi:hypothetical protein